MTQSMEFLLYVNRAQTQHSLRSWSCHSYLLASINQSLQSMSPIHRVLEVAAKETIRINPTFTPSKMCKRTKVIHVCRCGYDLDLYVKDQVTCWTAALMGGGFGYCDNVTEYQENTDKECTVCRRRRREQERERERRRAAERRQRSRRL